MTDLFDPSTLTRAPQEGPRKRQSCAPVMAVRDLGYETPAGQVLLQDVSFDLEPGAILAIAGPNGAGKSTLLDLLAGLAVPQTGHVAIEGQAMSALTPVQRARKIAVVSQHASPDARLRLRDYVALGQMPIRSEYSAQDHAAAMARVLASTDLLELADKPIGHLSGGERQRAHIARALAQKPRLLFLDEPTNHLDPDAKGRMLSLISALGITVVIVLHDLVMIPEFATHAALMKDTRLIAFGPAQTVLTPQAVRQTFGVDYLLLAHEDRQIPALDIRKTEITL